MELIKDIDWQNYNQVVIKSIDSNDMIICDIQQVVDGMVIKSDTNIGFRQTDKIPFKLTEMDIATLYAEPIEEIIEDVDVG